MSAAHKYKHYTPDSPKQDAKKNEEDKRVIQNLKAMITKDLLKDEATQKKAALIIEKLINS
jgi:hypothetical protein